MKVQIDQKIDNFFAVLKPVLKFLYQNGKHGCVFFVVRRTVSQCIKMHQLICHPFSWQRTAPSPCPSFSTDAVNSTMLFGCG